MVNPPQRLRELLLANSTITTAFGSRVWAAVDTPQPGYKPSDGKALVFKARDGYVPTENTGYLAFSFQFKVYAANELAAWQGYMTLFDALDGKANQYIKSVEAEVLGQSLREPDSNWPYVLAFFSVRFANP